ncbi:hypothetical protein [Rhodococcus erythropolis]|uniref:hypothetical protein n=1 Tax=Rhodococcus erythropolis TaxID=1833 RepID=UPI001BEBEB06|nr:hypothetical protein [Rhodococcus erythropolis]MBT2268808.1 hypothetical protein [Rhodococcus erythropolis]
MSIVTPVTDLDKIEPPRRYRTHNDLIDDLESMFESFPATRTPAFQSVLKVARGKHVSRQAQVIAISEAVAASASTSHPALEQLAAFQKSVNAEQLIRDELPDWRFEESRPYWSNPEKDSQGYVEERKASVEKYQHCKWVSDSTYIPLLKSPYYGKRRDNGNFRHPDLALAIEQAVFSNEPLLAIELQSWTLEGDERTTSRQLVRLSMDDAVNLARAILLKVDVARGTSDDIGQVLA